MMRFLGGCVRRLLMLAALVVCAGFAWHYRDAIRVAWRAFDLPGGREQVPSAELAEAAQARLAVLSTGDARERVVLTEAEVQSLVEYRIAEYLPGYVVAPRVALENGRLVLQAKVPTERFPRLDELGDAIGFLPDTTEVVVTGHLIPLGDGRVGLAVNELTASNIPLPRGLIPSVLQRLGRDDEPGLPSDALALPLPAGAVAAYVHGDSLVFLPRLDRAR